MYCEATPLPSLSSSLIFAVFVARKEMAQVFVNVLEVNAYETDFYIFDYDSLYVCLGSGNGRVDREY